MRSLAFLGFWFLASGLLAQDWAEKPVAAEPQGALYPLPTRPDYARIDAWAAHPEIVDGSDRRIAAADRVSGEFSGSGIPTFFIYPTHYEVGPKWNADIYDATYRQQVDEGTLANQAAVFNGIGHVWAPHYRQMKLDGYYTHDSAQLALAYVAFDSAYQDVRRAFLKFVELQPAGQTFVLASHSQGTDHAKRLLKEVILTSPDLRERMKLAYLVGNVVELKEFNGLPLCTEPDQTHCFLNWRTYGQDFYPEKYGDRYAVLNPVTWKVDGVASRRREHLGALLPSGRRGFAGSFVVRTDQGTLRVERLRPLLKVFYNWKNYHIADYNLVWFNVRQNLHERLTSGKPAPVRPTAKDYVPTATE